jgi:hypothetical protein
MTWFLKEKDEMSSSEEEIIRVPLRENGIVRST